MPKINRSVNSTARPETWMKKWLLGINPFKKKTRVSGQPGATHPEFLVFRRKKRLEREMLEAEAMARDPEVAEAFSAVIEAGQAGLPE
jgi:hypothetical protein